MKTEYCKKPKWLGLFVVLLFLQTTVVAGYFLPESSLWQGSRYYNENDVYAFVEYAVYDTESPDYHNVLDDMLDGFPDVGDGRYIYAYEVYNLGSSLPPIVTFELLGGNPAAASGIGSVDDGEGGLMPTNDGSSFLWMFENGIFVYNEHSAFMVFSSDSGPVAGSYRLTTLSEGGDEPPVNTPEPATVALLSVGIGILIRKKKVHFINK